MIDHELLDRIIRQNCGSGAAGEDHTFRFRRQGRDGPNSDLDLLIIKSCPRRRTVAMQIYSKVGGMGCAPEITVVTPENVERYGYSSALVIEPALREGRVVYAA